MKTLALIVALASCEVQEIREVPAAAETAAPVVPEVTVVREARASSAPAVGTLDGVAGAAAAVLRGSVGLAEATPLDASALGRLPVFPFPASGAASSIAAMYAHLRLLSGPGSVLRRLEAAKSRGDLGEVRRMEAKMDELIAEAVMSEGGGNP